MTIDPFALAAIAISCFALGLNIGIAVMRR